MILVWLESDVPSKYSRRHWRAALLALPADGRCGRIDAPHRDRRAVGFKAQVVSLAAPVGRRTDDAGDLERGEIAELHAPSGRLHHRRYRQAIGLWLAFRVEQHPV